MAKKSVLETETRRLEADTKVMLHGGLRDFGRSQFFGGAELLRCGWRSGVKVEIGFWGSALESLLRESIAGCNDPCGVNILQSIDGVAIVEVPGLLWRQLSTLSRVELYGIPYFWMWSTNSSELRTQFHPIGQGRRSSR